MKLGDFCAHEDDNNNDNRTNQFTPCTCARGKKVLKVREEGQAGKQYGTHASILLRVDSALFLGFTLNCVDCAVTASATSKLIHLTCKAILSEGTPLFQ